MLGAKAGRCGRIVGGNGRTHQGEVEVAVEVTERVKLGEFDGTVKWFNAQKGYGFIARENTETPNDIFVHHSAIKMEGFRTLQEGEIVRYELFEGPKGLQAANVVRL